MITRKYADILHEKEEIAQNKLQNIKPVVVASLKEGILLLAANPDLKLNKIYRLYDRIACVISGSRANFKQIFRILRIGVENWASFYSEGDIVLGELAEEFASLLKERFEDINRIFPYTVDIVLVEVAPVQKDDILIHIDFRGDLKDCASCFVLGNESEKADLEKQTRKLLNENTPINEVFAEMAKKDKELREANKGRLETVFLNRERVLKKEFDEVFQRIEGEKK